MKGITDRAAQALLEALEEDGVPEDQCVRYVGSAHGGEFEVDGPCPDDLVFDHEGRMVLAVGPETVEGCPDHVLDFESDQFTLLRYSRVRSCRVYEAEQLATV
ncbi:MAG: hypothetical protein JSV78_11285 [Phycisphaerales bacterium]|nr:MAG: hypothetical protein JSV78_11285 [Phycisphaerales bacterium]